MIKPFRDRYLEQFYLEGRRSRLIPGMLERQLARKLDMLAAAQQERDYYKRLSGPFQGWSSLRVNMHWRLMFQWRHDAAERIYLDPHQDT